MDLITAFIAGVAAFIVAVFSWIARAGSLPEPIEPLVEIPHAEPPKPAPEPVIVPEPPKPLPMPTKTKREHLYDTSKDCIGRDMSPLDMAPDNLACLESLDGVYMEAFGEHLFSIGDRLSTARGYASLRVDPRVEFIDKEQALPGDIAIAPTGKSTKGAPHGHCWVWGRETAMSNDSYDRGKWKANYKLANVFSLFHDKLGFPIFFFRVKGDVV